MANERSKEGNLPTYYLCSVIFKKMVYSWLGHLQQFAKCSKSCIFEGIKSIEIITKNWSIVGWRDVIWSHVMIERNHELEQILFISISWEKTKKNGWEIVVSGKRQHSYRHLSKIIYRSLLMSLGTTNKK